MYLKIIIILKINRILLDSLSRAAQQMIDVELLAFLSMVESLIG